MGDFSLVFSRSWRIHSVKAGFAEEPATDGVCKEGIYRPALSLRKVYDDGSDLAAREDMCVASLFGGLALANAKLGAVHGFVGPLGGMIPAPHGIICGRILPYAMKANVGGADSERSRVSVSCTI